MNYTCKLLLLGIMAVLLTGCGKTNNATVDRVKVIRGNGQCAMPGEDFEHPLLIELTSQAGKNILGGNGKRQPVVGKKVFFRPCPLSDLTLSAPEGISDAGGMVHVRVKAGRKIGDQYLKIIPEEAPNKVIRVRFVTGVEISGGNQEVGPEDSLPEPISVKVVDSDGKPMTGIPVYFKILHAPSPKDTGALTQSRVLTDDDGEAKTNMITGTITGDYHINVEISDPKGSLVTRGIQIREMALNLRGLLISTLGGLAIFVFGMKLMSDGLNKAAGDKMRNILHFFSSNRFVAVFAGAMVTAIIQSSSASTVMVIGFVNAGLLNLVQSIGIIFGANIGTTITAQIISFDIAGIALPAIITGLVMMFFTLKWMTGWGETVLGFGLLFFGMAMMSDSLKLISDFPAFINFFSSFDCSPEKGVMPLGATLGAIGIGIVVTVIIQSSSAVMGIILALGASGLLNLYTAVPLILGSNIGTTITALLAAIPTNRIGKQAAIAHTIFNVSGVLLMLIGFYIPSGNSEHPIFFSMIEAITPGNVLTAIPQNMPRHIANAHTMFNVFTTLLLIPFIPQIAKLCEWLLPAKKEKVKYNYLEPYLLDTPAIALEQTVRSLCYMVKESWQMVDEAFNNHFMKSNVDEVKFKVLEEREDRVDDLQAEITDYLIQITRRELSNPQSEIIPLLMHCTNDAERVADHTANILALTERLQEASGDLSIKGRNDLETMYSFVKDLAINILAALESQESSYITKALADEREINRLATELEAGHIERLRLGLCDAIVGVIYIELIGELEKIADHLTNIAERTRAIQKHYVDLGWDSPDQSNP